MNDPVMFKTLAGVDYIGRLVSEDDSGYIVEKMFAIVPNQNERGETNIQFGAPVHPALGKVSNSTHGSADVKLNRSTVIFTYEPNVQLVDAYAEAASGIQIAKTMPSNISR